MGLFKRGTTWWMYLEPTKKRESCGTTDEAEALEIYKRRKREVYLAQYANHTASALATSEPKASKASKANATKMKFGHAVDLTLREYFMQKSKKSTVKVLNSTMEKLVRIIGSETDVAKINEDHYRTLRDTLRSDGVADITINKYFAGLNRVLKHVRAEHKVSCDPGKRGMYLPMTKTGRIRVISREEESKIREYFRNPKKLKKLKEVWTGEDLTDILDVLFNTGMRRGECFSFTAGMFHGNRIEFQADQHKSGGKCGTKSVALNSKAAQVIADRIARYGYQEDDRVFPYTPEAFTRLWQTMRKTIGLENDEDFVPHAIRHTFATRLLEKNVPIYTVKDLMGHSTVKTTEIYAHICVDNLVNAAELLAD